MILLDTTRLSGSCQNSLILINFKVIQYANTTREIKYNQHFKAEDNSQMSLRCPNKRQISMLRFTAFKFSQKT